jgi:hypothetical protein
MYDCILGRREGVKTFISDYEAVAANLQAGGVVGVSRRCR